MNLLLYIGVFIVAFFMFIIMLALNPLAGVIFLILFFKFFKWFIFG